MITQPCPNFEARPGPVDDMHLHAQMIWMCTLRCADNMIKGARAHRHHEMCTPHSRDTQVTMREERVCLAMHVVTCNAAQVDKVCQCPGGKVSSKGEAFWATISDNTLSSRYICK